ncbi:hypothetical protein DICVIV_13618, partial [Dictyocaulus viviparus]
LIGGPEFSTSVVATHNGCEQRNIDWFNALASEHTSSRSPAASGAQVRETVSDMSSHMGDFIDSRGGLANRTKPCTSIVTTDGKRRIVDNQLMNVADECLKTLATHFALHVAIRATKPIIAQEQLMNVADECLKTLATHFALHVAIRATKPIIAQECYSNPQSSVRKSTLFCMVTIVNKLEREPVNPYLTSLPNSKGINCINYWCITC